MGLKVGVLDVSVASGTSRYGRAHLTTDDTKRLVKLVKARSDLTWEELAEHLGYGDSSGTDLMHLASGAKTLGAGRGMSVPAIAARRGWLTGEEADSFMGAISCARSQIESAASEAAFLKKAVGVLINAATRELGLPLNRVDQLVLQSAHQLLLDVKMAMSDELLLLDRLAYCDVDEAALTMPVATKVGPRFPSF